MDRPIYDEVLAATTTVDLGAASPEYKSRFLVTVEEVTSMTVSIQPNGAASGSAKSGSGALTKQPIGYVNAGTGAQVNGATTPITAEGNYLIEASGMDVNLVVTVTGGSARVVVVPVRG